MKNTTYTNHLTRECHYLETQVKEYDEYDRYYLHTKWNCSNCNFEIYNNDYCDNCRIHNYCQNCGYRILGVK